MTTPPNSKAGHGTAVLLALAILLCWSPIFSGGAKYFLDQDFIGFYVAATMALDGGLARLHDPAVFTAKEADLGRTDLLPFARPHLYTALLSPVAPSNSPTRHSLFGQLPSRSS